MADIVYLKRRDLAPLIELTLYDGEGSSRTRVDLADASSVKFIMATSSGTVIINKRSMTVDQDDEDPATHGNVSLALQAADTETAGTFKAEVEVTWPGTLPQTFPTRGKLAVVIEADLA